jgi:hypothetical protein
VLRTAMPEAPVDEHRQPLPGECDVRSRRAPGDRHWVIDSKAMASPVQLRTQRQFGRRIAPSVAPHTSLDTRARGFGRGVHRDFHLRRGLVARARGGLNRAQREDSTRCDARARFSSAALERAAGLSDGATHRRGSDRRRGSPRRLVTRDPPTVVVPEASGSSVDAGVLTTGTRAGHFKRPKNAPKGRPDLFRPARIWLYA